MRATEKPPFAWLSDADWRGASIAERALLVAAYECDVREPRETGRNDGPRIRVYQRAGRIGPPLPYCAAFVSFCLNAAGWDVAWPENRASTRSWVKLAERYGALVKWQESERGHLGGWSYVKHESGTPKLVGHIYFVVGPGKKKHRATIEGNILGPDGKQGVHRNERDIVRHAFAIDLDLLYHRLGGTV